MMLSFVPDDHNILGVYPGKTITSHVGKSAVFSIFNWEIHLHSWSEIPATKKVGFTGVFSFTSKVHFKTRSVGPKFGEKLASSIFEGPLMWG